MLRVSLEHNMHAYERERARMRVTEQMAPPQRKESSWFRNVGFSVASMLSHFSFVRSQPDRPMPNACLEHARGRSVSALGGDSRVLTFGKEPFLHV